MKQDITMYSDEELSLLVQNDEFLYNEAQRIRIFRVFKELIDELFIYTNEQLKDLQYDFDNDLI